MSEYQLHQAGTIQKPGFLGRLVRFLSAALMIYLTVVVIDNYQRYLNGEVHDAMLWFLVFLALHLLPPVINISFGVNLKSRPQWWFILAFFISVYIGYLVEGAGWGLVSGSLVLALQLYVFIHLAISFFLAAVIATPGCEMRSIPHLIALISKKDASEHYCPGYIDNVDRWERKTFPKG